MRKRNVFFLTILLASLGTVLLLPATDWLARLELKGAIGITNPAMASNAALNKSTQAVAAAHPGDFDIAYAATLRQAGPLMNASNTGVTEGTSIQVPERLEVLKERFPNQPELYAHQLRYWSLGPLRLSHRDPENKKPNQPAETVAAVWGRAEQAAIQGERIDPDNSYFPLMKAIALFAQDKDTEAYEALHVAANASVYNDYIWQEATSFWKLTDTMNGQTGSLPKMAQMAAILFPHYTQFRTAAKVAAAEATRREKAGDSANAVRIRHDLSLIGLRIRDQGKAMITNLIGIAIFHLAAQGSPGWAEIADRNLTEEQRNEKVIERGQRYVAYLKSIGATDEARSYEIGLWSSTQAKKLVRQVTQDQVSGWNKLLFNTIKAGISQTVGALLLTNMGWLLLLGAGAVLLCHTRGIRTGEGLPLLVHLAIWGTVIGIAIATAYLQAQGTNPIQNLLSLSASTSTPEGGAGVIAPFLLMVALSFPIPLLTLLVLAIRAKIKRERTEVAIARGMRVVTLPVAALLSLFFAAQVFWTAGIEKGNLAWMEGMARDGEVQFYARQVGTEWPVVVQR